MSIEIEGVDPKAQSQFRVGARRPVAHLHDVLEDRNRIVERFPLLSRGWVYQERILSRRFLHFGPSEIHWECHQEVACQCGGGKAALEMNPSGANTANQGLAITNSRMRVDEMVLLWVGQIQNLTSLSFTFISDQLPALSGIATLVRQSRPSGRYLAGLWEEGLIFWLCWATEGVADKPRTLHNTPSWSWASVQGRISFDYMRFYFMQGPWGERGHKYLLLANAAQVHVHQCIPSQPSLSGKLDVGVLSIAAPVARATLHCRREKYPGKEVLGLSFQDNESAQSGSIGGDGFVYPFQWDVCNDSVFASDWDGWDTLVVHFLSYERLDVAYDGPSWMRSFLIVKPLDETETKYQRVGILCTDITGGFLPSKDWRELAETQKGERIDIEDGFLQHFRRVSSTQVVYLA
ncbi:hypothetical protein ACJ41O_012681 [Fusarium nematophilum]